MILEPDEIKLTQVMNGQLVDEVKKQSKRRRGIFSKMFKATTMLSSLSSEKLMRKGRQTISFNEFTCDCQVRIEVICVDSEVRESMVDWAEI